MKVHPIIYVVAGISAVAFAIVRGLSRDAKTKTTSRDTLKGDEVGARYDHVTAEGVVSGPIRTTSGSGTDFDPTTGRMTAGVDRTAEKPLIHAATAALVSAAKTDGGPFHTSFKAVAKVHNSGDFVETMRLGIAIDEAGYTGKNHFESADKSVTLRPGEEKEVAFEIIDAPISDWTAKFTVATLKINGHVAGVPKTIQDS